MGETQTLRHTLADIPWLRLVVVATIAAVTTTFAQVLIVGETNPAITAGVTASITAVLGMGVGHDSAEGQQPADEG